MTKKKNLEARITELERMLAWERTKTGRLLMWKAGVREAWEPFERADGVERPFALLSEWLTRLYEAIMKEPDLSEPNPEESFNRLWSKFSAAMKEKEDCT